MKREEWVDREIRTVVQGIHHVLGVGNAGEEPVSPLTISADPPDAGDDPAASEAVTPPAPVAGARRAARRKRKRARS